LLFVLVLTAVALKVSSMATALVLAPSLEER
jgi:hypothetical protein